MFKRVSLIFTGLNAMIIGSAYAVTLEESVEKAINFDPQLRQVYASFEASKAEIGAAKSGYFPTVTLQAGGGREYTKTQNDLSIAGSRNTEALDASLVLRQSLFSGFGTKNETQRVKYETEAERYRLLYEAEDKAVEVVNAFLGVIEAEKILELTTANLKDHEDIYEDVKTKVNNQLAARSDLAQVESRLANARASQIAAQNRVLDLESEYYRLTNSEPENLIEPSFNKELLPATLDEAIELAKANHKAIKSAKFDISASESAYKAASSTYYPDVSLEISANYDKSANGDPLANIGTDNEDASIMLRMEYKLFQGGKAAAQRKAAAWRKQEALDVRNQTQRQIVDEVKRAWYAHELLGSQLEFLKYNVEKSKMAEEAYREQFKVGKRELLDVLIAKTELFRARQNYIESYYQQAIATYTLKNKIGVLLQSLYVTTPKTWGE